MEKVYPNLFRTEPYELFAFGSFKVSAYLLVRPEGNLLIYSSKKIEKYFSFIEEKGGIQALNSTTPPTDHPPVPSLPLQARQNGVLPHSFEVLYPGHNLLEKLTEYCTVFHG